jgi:hypothetical protein
MPVQHELISCLQLTTAFTIAFVTICSTMVKRWALYKAERGGYLAELEQLQSSTSLPSTAKMIWSLRRFGMLSGGLIFLWSFYYLGSQACQREYQLVDSKPYRKLRIAIAEPTLPSQFAVANMSSADNSEDLQIYVRSTIVSWYSKMMERQSTGYDYLGFPLPPMIETISKKTPSAVDKFLGRIPWSKVGSMMTQEFASYIGPQISTMTPDGNVDFLLADQFLGEMTFGYEYFFVKCSEPEKRAFGDFPNSTIATSDVAINFTSNDRFVKDGQPTVPKQFQLWGRYAYDEELAIFPPNASVVSVCNLTSSLIDVKANCQPKGCTPKKVRYNRSRPGPSVITPFDNDTLATDFLSSLQTALGAPTQGIGNSVDTSSLNEAMLYSLALFAVANDTTPYSAQTIKTFESSIHSFATIINTYYSASQIGGCGDVGSGQSDSTCVISDVKGAIYNLHYLLSIPWVVIDFLSCLVLLVTAIFAYWLRMKTMAPDILGYVSSLTRENPHFDLPTDHGSALSGLERAKLWGDVKIKIGAYHGEDNTRIPRVVVSHVIEGYEAGALRKNGKYA